MSWITRSAVLRSVYKLFEEGTLSGLSDEQLLERLCLGLRREHSFRSVVPTARPSRVRWSSPAHLPATMLKYRTACHP
jgi:hypothetical protein